VNCQQIQYELLKRMRGFILNRFGSNRRRQQRRKHDVTLKKEISTRIGARGAPRATAERLVLP
jgi:hypothetical protein